MLLDLLKDAGWFMLAFLGGALVIALLYGVLMNRLVYRLSYFRVRHYLDEHGRGNFPEENNYMIGKDIFTRLASVVLFTLITAVPGCIYLPNWPLKIGFALAEFSFLFLMTWIEARYTIRVGRLVSVDEVNHVAYFESLDQLYDAGFCYCYERKDSRDFLCEEKKYVVVDYPLFKMLGIVDVCEWEG